MRRLTCLMVALLLTAAPAPAQDTTEADPAAGLRGLLRHYTLGATAERAGDPAAALRHYLAGIEAEPTSPHLRLAAARAAAALFDAEMVRRQLEHFVALGACRDFAADEAFAELVEDPALEAIMAANTANRRPPAPAALVATLAGPDLWSEGIASDRTTGALYAGSVKHGKIVRLRGGVQEDFGTTAADSLMEILGLDIDEVRRRIWAVTGRDRAEPGASHDFGEAPRDNAVVVYDLASGRQVEAFTSPADPDAEISMWNDVSVAPDGTAYATDMTGTRVLKLRPGHEPEVLRDLATIDHPNGLVVSADGTVLYVAGLEGVAVIDLATGTETRLVVPDDLCVGLGDGMALDGRHLFIVQNNSLLGMRTLHCVLTEDGRGVVAAEALGCTLPAGLMPYTCAAGEGVVYVNGTAPFDRYDDEEVPPAPVIVELPYGLR